MREWRESRDEWSAAYHVFGGAAHSFGLRTWKALRPMKNPRLFYGARGGGTTLLLWDPETCRTVALNSRL